MSPGERRPISSRLEEDDREEKRRHNRNRLRKKTVLEKETEEATVLSLQDKRRTQEQLKGHGRKKN